MSEHAEVVVVGGGVQGAILAMHLADAGVESVRVVERDEPFQGTSAAAAGFIAYWVMENPEFGPEEAAVEKYGLDFYRNLHEEGRNIDYVNNGLLIVTDEDCVWPQVKRCSEFDWGGVTRIVSREEIADLTSGLVEPSPEMRGIFHPPGAQMFAPKLGRALIECLAQRKSITLDERRPVTGLRTSSGRITGVHSATGTIETDTVVLATGAWTNPVLRELGVRLPMVPRITSRLITEPLGLPESLPSMMFMGLTGKAHDENFWIRRQNDSLLWGGTYTMMPRDAFVEKDVPPRVDEVPLDGVLHIQELGQKASRFMPLLSTYRSLRVKHGAPCFTPDSRALVGPIPEVEGLFAMTGDCEAGVTHAPGFAKVLTEQIVSGRSAFTDGDVWRPDRFGDEFKNDAEVAAAVDGLRDKWLAAHH